MLAILFTNLAFLSYMAYIVLEKRSKFYKSRNFWLFTIAFLASLYIALYYLKMANPGGHMSL